MNTLYFKYAIEVERSRSITQAAENLFMAQPNLSKAIKELEDTLGYAIFERTPKGVIPTAQGTQFLQHARNIVQQLEQMESIADKGSDLTQRFSLSFPRVSYISQAITRLVSKLDKEKGIHVNVMETNSIQSVANVVDGRFNLGIIRYQMTYEQYFKDFLSEKKLCYEPIWEFEHLVIMSKNNPLAEAETITVNDLKPYIEIAHGDNVIPYLMSENVGYSEASTKRRIDLYERGNQFELLCSIPETFMWVSPVPNDIVQRYNLVQRKCPFQGNKYKDVLIYQKGYAFTDIDKRFIDKLYSSKNEVSFCTYR